MTSTVTGNIILIVISIVLALLIAYKTKFPNKKAMPILGLAAGIWITIFIALQVTSIIIGTMLFLSGYCIGIYTTGNDDGKWEIKIKGFIRTGLRKLGTFIKKMITGKEDSDAG